MSTLKIFFKKGLFVGTNGRYVHSFESKHVAGNGWEVVINEDGSIKCESVRKYSDGIHSMRYVIQKNGYAKLTLKVPHKNVKTLKKGFVLPKGTSLSEGTIGLAGGYIDGRYAYFRDSSFQEFLDRFGITAVKHESPNQEFKGIAADYGQAYQKTFSDGQIKEDFQEWSPFNWTIHTVEDATWTIVERRCHYHDKHNYSRVLYTEVKNPVLLHDSFMKNPQIKQYVLEQDVEAKLRELDGREVHTLEDVKSAVDEILAIAPKSESRYDETKIGLFLKSFDLENNYKFKLELIHLSYDYGYKFQIKCSNGHFMKSPVYSLVEGFLS